MSEIKSKSGDAAIILTPIAVKDRGNPNWYQVRVGLRERQATIEQVVALTAGDLAEVSRGLRALGPSGRFELNGQDEDFQIRVEPALSAGDVQVGVWIGEPYLVMRGFRIVAEQQEIERFANALETESAAIK